MVNELERQLFDVNRNRFKSNGERKIAYFLERNNIQYRYESPVLVNSNDSKYRIWYPDFFLPEFNTYIEYYGVSGNRNYNLGIKRKELTYLESGLDVISIYPDIFKSNWQAYLMNGLKSTVLRHYQSLMSKPYWSAKLKY